MKKQIFVSLLAIFFPVVASAHELAELPHINPHWLPSVIVALLLAIISLAVYHFRKSL